MTVDLTNLYSYDSSGCRWSIDVAAATAEQVELILETMPLLTDSIYALIERGVLREDARDAFLKKVLTK